jgi:hypothetical protein
LDENVVEAPPGFTLSALGDNDALCYG